MAKNVSRKKLSETVARKFDAGLRRLMRMTDKEIKKDVEKKAKKLKKNLKKIADVEERLKEGVAEADKPVISRMAKAQKARLIPHPVFSAVVVAGNVVPIPIKIRALVRFTGNRDDLVSLGLEVRFQAHDIFTVIGTKDQLANLASQRAALRIRLPRIMLPCVEDAAQQAEVHAVHQSRPPINPAGFQGNGVIVGVVDGPLDVTHHGFQDPVAPHDTRALYYWVQAADNPAAPGQTPQQYHNANPATTPDFTNPTALNVGKIYDGNYIDTALGLAGGPYGNGTGEISCDPDWEEHGTHVAGIAVGNGHVNNWATAPVRISAAPQADLVHVRIGNLTWAGYDATTEVALLEGIDFIFRCADFHNVPAVVNVSQATNMGPHNGASDFDQALDNLLHSFDNRSIVFAAGNDNNVNGFREGIIGANTTEVFTMTPAVFPNMFGAEIATDRWVDIWYLGPELDYRVECGGVQSSWQGAGADYNGTLNGFDVDVDRDIEPGGGLRNIRIYVQGALSTDPWTIRLRNPSAANAAHYYAWVAVQGNWADLSGATNDEYTISDTSCARSILTVGACQKLHPPLPANGEDIADYSGAGPTLDGRIKPEIVAIGGTRVDQVFSCNSNQASGYTGKQGTSMAAPLVSGSVALLFEQAQSQGRLLNQDTIKALLTQSANRTGINVNPDIAGYVDTERNRYGNGRLRMIAPIDHSAPLVNVDVWVRTASDDYGETPYPGGCFCHAPDIRVFDAGTNNEITNLVWGATYDVRVTARNLGSSNAVGTTVRLKYTYPWTAPNNWVDAEDAANNVLVQTIDIDALSQEEVTFQWQPEAGEIPGAPAGATHFCLLAELDHPQDALAFSAPGSATGSAWSTNIKGTNNVALRNLHIQ